MVVSFLVEIFLFGWYVPKVCTQVYVGLFCLRCVWEPGLSRGGFSPRCKLLLVGSFNITIEAQMLCLIECFQNDILWASLSVTLIRADTAQQSFHQLALLFCAISCGGIAL